jgi:hypothetical protein
LLKLKGSGGIFAAYPFNLLLNLLLQASGFLWKTFLKQRRPGA